MPRYSDMPDRDDRGRFVSDDDHRGGRSYGGGRGYDDRSGRERDDRGRFVSDDDRRGSRASSRYDDDERRYSSRRDDDYSGDRGQDRGQGGWFGDSRGHAEAARLGWEHRRYDDDDRHSSRGYGDDRGRNGGSRYDDDRSASRRYDDDRGGYSRDRGQGGWFGDREGHAEAARRGWDGRRDDEDDRSYGRGRR